MGHVGAGVPLKVFAPLQRAPGLHEAGPMHLTSLSESAVEHELQLIFRLWDASEEESVAFRAWAHALAAACDGEDCAQELKQEQRALHAKLAENAIRQANIDLELVSRRFFMEWLCREVSPRRAA